MFVSSAPRLILPSVVFLLILTISKPSLSDNPVITVNGTDKGRVFDGIGGLNAGASSRLLIDYPQQQREEILDYLFKPDFGAALQINKVEIGGDANSTDGAEASHERTPTDRNYHRGYEWWLMTESKKRNPNVKLYILEWTAPGWINPKDNSVWTTANDQYIIDFMNHAQSDHGLKIDYVGGWNERGFNAYWYEGFRSALNKAGYGAVKIVADDSFSWSVGKATATDPAFAKSFEIIGQHYPDFSPAVLSNANYRAAYSTGKTIWLSEMGAKNFDTGAANLAKVFNESYIDDRATANINWATIWSVYPGLPDYGVGLMLANEPWSGSYQVGKSIWVCAHTTQFAQPGWQYLDSACGFFGGKPGAGSFVTLKSPDGTDYSMIVETGDAKAAQVQSFKVSGGLSTGTVHVWATNLASSDPNSWFVQQADLAPVDGKYSLTLQPGCLYTLTTTTGQHKGMTNPPSSKILALPYSDDFSSYAVGATPKYFSDQQGAFEVAKATGGRSGNCLRQVVASKPIEWTPDAPPSTVVGDSRWADYTISSNVLLEQPGHVDIAGRIESTSPGNSYLINGYHLRVTDAGLWSIIQKMSGNQTILAGGKVPFSLDNWHDLRLEMSGLQLSGWIDGVQVAKNVFASEFSHGLAGYEVSEYQNSEFQNFEVTAAPSGEKSTVIHPLSATATSENKGFEASKAIDGNPSTFWHTKFDPPSDPLPQSITVDLGSVKSFNTLVYTPRGDGNLHGTITKYVFSVSSDGEAFTQVAAGAWDDNAYQKTVSFPITFARYIKLTALNGDGGYASAEGISLALLSNP